MSLDREGRRLRAQAAAHAMHARNDSHAIAAKMREGLKAKYERQVDPDGLLDPEERSRRAEHARKADLARARLKAHQEHRLSEAIWSDGPVPVEVAS